MLLSIIPLEMVVIFFDLGKIYEDFELGGILFFYLNT